uniref:Uncharacterized protein n=1 Tax=Steinernema glaseri TaxID=37863 RepID=A0A1I7YEY0_9BILA
MSSCPHSNTVLGISCIRSRHLLIRTVLAKEESRSPYSRSATLSDPTRSIGLPTTIRSIPSLHSLAVHPQPLAMANCLPPWRYGLDDCADLL